MTRLANVAHFTASKHLGLICTAIFQSIEIKSEAGRVLVIELNFDAKLSPRKISLLFIRCWLFILFRHKPMLTLQEKHRTIDKFCLILGA